MIRPQNDMEVFFSMAQHGGRLQHDGHYSTYPFADSIKYGCVSVFEVGHDDKYLKEFNKDKLVYISPIKRERENAGRC